MIVEGKYVEGKEDKIVICWSFGRNQQMNIFMWISTDDELNDVIEMRRRTSKEDGGGLGDRF